MVAELNARNGLSRRISGEFPKLAYFGNVPVEDGLHGSAFLYRLFGLHPPERLLIMEDARRSRPDLRLRNVAYRNLALGFPAHGRFGTARFFLRLPAYRRAILDSVRDFRPDAIVSVAHGSEWLPAFLAARDLEVPYHLVVHDAGRSGRLLTGRAWLDWIDESIFRTVYRASRSRLCVSPYMEEEYRSRYGVAGRLLLPSAGIDCPEFSEPHQSLAADLPRLRVAYVGSLGLYDSDLCEVADRLHKIGGELVVFGPPSDHYERLSAGRSQTMRRMPALPEAEFIQALRSGADAAFLPMSFLKELRENMRLSFPSKLTAYCAAGLPVLVRGPDECSAIRWAKEHPGFALLVTDSAASSLDDALARLAGDAPFRVALAKKSLEIFSKYFRASVAQTIFYDSIGS